MSERITPQEALENAGLTVEDVVFGEIAPACCEDGCEVEPDGYCEHGHPSVLLKLGLI